ncbi:MAG: hypothetical protein Q8N82_06415, partial [Deltaproteobacteria bacterium]|nr:hypothetical protein [Deltaproteobacteria bacterium]
ELCYQDCPVDIKFYESPNDRRCIRCLVCLRESCAFGAISWEMGGTSELFVQGRGKGVTIK